MSMPGAKVSQVLYIAGPKTLAEYEKLARENFTLLL
jgi:hypothetical protein